VTEGLLFAVTTLATWLGWGLLVRAATLLARLISRAPGLDVAQAQRGLLGSAGIGTAALFLARAAPGYEPGWNLPLVWFVMPLAGWGAAAAGAMAIVRATQAIGSIDRGRGLLAAAGLWLATAGVLGFAASRSPEKIEVLRGWLPITPSGVALVVGLGLAAMAAMTISARHARARGLARAAASHLTLLAGSVVFGIPFAWLLVTSFKEDRDMANPHGIVWMPRVQETVPFYDRREPRYRGEFEGQTVEGTVVERRADGAVVVEIIRPAALRGLTFPARLSDLKEIPKEAPVVSGEFEGVAFVGKVVEELKDGSRRVMFMSPAAIKGREEVFKPAEVEPVRNPGLRWRNYPDALEYLPPETKMGLVYLRNTLIIVVMSVIGTVLSSALVAYGFSRLSFPGRDMAFKVMLSTMMLPGAVTLLPTFLIFRSLGWIDTLYPLWVPAFFAGAFNVFLLRQFFMGIPRELEDAAKIDGCSYLRTFWAIMLPQIKPALAVVAIWTFMGAWNNFMGPLIYISSPEKMPISYALQLFQGDRSGEPGLLMAFATMTMLPVLLLFFFAQRVFIEGATLSGLGGR
jgi:multiple sugar transport system permease protein